MSEVDKDFCRRNCNAWAGSRKKNGEGRCLAGLFSGIPQDEWLCEWDVEKMKRRVGGLG